MVLVSTPIIILQLDDIKKINVDIVIKIDCTCKTTDLWAYGCRCGAFEREKQNGLQNAEG